jgi:hypothetical protein
VTLGCAAVLGAEVGQHPVERHAVLVEERDHTVIEQIGRHQRGRAIIEFGEGQLGVGVEEGPLVEAPHALECPHIEGVLRAAVAWALALELAVRLLVARGLFQRRELRLAQHQTLLRTLGFQPLEPLLHGLELVALPHAAHPSRRHTQPAPLQFIGDPYLTPRRAVRSPT